MSINQKVLEALKPIVSSISVLTPPEKLAWVDVEDEDEPLQFADFKLLIGKEPVRLTYSRTASSIELSAESVDELRCVFDTELQGLGITSSDAKLAINNMGWLELAPTLLEHLQQARQHVNARVHK